MGSWAEHKSGPYKIRRVRLNGYEIQVRNARGILTWKRVPAETHYRVTLRGLFVDTFLTLAAARRWCKKQPEYCDANVI